VLRLYVPAAPAPDGRVQISGAELRHLHTVRLGPGERLRLFDAAGAEHEVVLERIGARTAVARVVATVRVSRESPLDLVLAPTLVKGTKLDWVVEKATELGVRRVAPVVTRHAVALGAHVERWRRIARAAAQQCGRTRVPTIDEPAPLDVLLAAPWPGLRLVAWEDEAAVRLADLPAAAAAVVVVVGPEGGFHPGEVERAHAAGFRTVSLGRRVLRAETAAVTAVALCQHRWGDG
jgi:16S rRNA (uracil1498-N3)-methyltransferase